MNDIISHVVGHLRSLKNMLLTNAVNQRLNVRAATGLANYTL